MVIGENCQGRKWAGGTYLRSNCPGAFTQGRRTQISTNGELKRNTERRNGYRYIGFLRYF